MRILSLATTTGSMQKNNVSATNSMNFFLFNTARRVQGNSFSWRSSEILTITKQKKDGLAA